MRYASMVLVVVLLLVSGVAEATKDPAQKDPTWCWVPEWGWVICAPRRPRRGVLEPKLRCSNSERPRVLELRICLRRQRLVRVLEWPQWYVPHDGGLVSLGPRCLRPRLLS